MRFHIENMTCGHCVRSITRAIQAIAPAGCEDYVVALFREQLRERLADPTRCARHERSLAAAFTHQHCRLPTDG